MSRLVPALLLLISCVDSAGAAVLVIANYSPDEVVFTLAADERRPVKLPLLPGHCAPFDIEQRAELSFLSARSVARYELAPYGIYYFHHDNTQLKLGQIDLGLQLARPTQPSPAVRKVDDQTAAGVLTVKLLVDDDEPATQKIWEPQLRREIEFASRVLQRHCGIRLKIAAVGTWESDDRLKTLDELVRDFQAKASPDPARLAIGFTRQLAMALDDFAQHGSLRRPLDSHILIPQPQQPAGRLARLKMLVHELGHYFGASHSPDPTSVMRPDLSSASGAEEAGQFTFDPINTLVMSLVRQDLQQRGICTLAELNPSTSSVLDAAYTVIAQGLLTDRYAAHEAHVHLAADSGSRATDARLDKPRDSAPGSRQRPPASHPTAVPVANEIIVPDFPGAYAILGAIGSDTQGRIWFGVSSEGVEVPSAHLFEYDPATMARPVDRGDVVTALKRLGKYQNGGQQGKIYSSIVQADDGHLYFASTGDDGLDWVPDTAPKWGSHLWRLRLPEKRWEHVAQVPDGIADLNVSGGYVYALTNTGEYVFQFNTRSGELQRHRIDSTRGWKPQRLVGYRTSNMFLAGRRTAEDNDSQRALPVVVGQSPATPLGILRIETPEPIAAYWVHDDHALGIALSSADLYLMSRGTGTSFSCERLDGFTPQTDGVLTTALLAGPQHWLGVWCQRDSQCFWYVRDLAKSLLGTYPIDTGQPLSALQLLGCCRASQTGALYFAGRYRRGALQINPSLVDALKSRGVPREKIDQLLINAQRTYQPVLLSVVLTPARPTDR